MTRSEAELGRQLFAGACGFVGGAAGAAAQAGSGPGRMTRSEAELARKLFAGSCEFVAGAADADAIPPSRLPEIAVVGRSNVGKSSLLNALTGRGHLARVSST